MTDNRTTELREKLTERGVEYEADDHKTYAYTYWGDWAYCEPLDAKPGTLGAQCELMLIPATPDQAIAATLGSGTCELTEVEIDCGTASEWMLDRFFVYDSVYECSCGETFGHVARNRPNFCPNCGRKVVSA